MSLDHHDIAPIFVVGAGRSGTTLLASMIASHSDVGGGPETHFFDKIRATELGRAAADPSWPSLAVDCILGLRLAEQPVHSLFGVKPREVSDFLSHRAPSVAAMLESLTTARARSQGKSRWVEKTPNHLLHVQQIRVAFPKARIVRIVRDPRDAAYSMRQLPSASTSAVANALALLDDWHSRSREFFGPNFPDALTVRFEDLVVDPENVLTKVCAHLDLPFEDRMLQYQEAARLISTPNETWKTRNAQALDTNRVDRWSETLPSEVAQAISLTCAEAIAEFGYRDVGVVNGVKFLPPTYARLLTGHEPRIVRYGSEGIAVRISRRSIAPSDRAVSRVAHTWLTTRAHFRKSSPALVNSSEMRAKG